MNKTQSSQLIAPQFGISPGYVQDLCAENLRRRTDDYDAYQAMKNA